MAAGRGGSEDQILPSNHPDEFPGRVSFRSMETRPYESLNGLTGRGGSKDQILPPNHHNELSGYISFVPMETCPYIVISMIRLFLCSQYLVPAILSNLLDVSKICLHGLGIGDELIRHQAEMSTLFQRLVGLLNECLGDIIIYAFIRMKRGIGQDLVVLLIPDNPDSIACEYSNVLAF
jgi:hypothetical protein